MKKIFQYILIMAIFINFIVAPTALARTIDYDTIVLNDTSNSFNVEQVTGITAKPVDTNAAKIKWNIVDGVTGYQLFRATEENGSYGWIKNCTTNEVNNYSLTPGADYWYKVRAYIEYGDGTRIYGDYSSPVSVHILGKINNLKIYGQDTNCAKLTWDKVDGATGYQVFRTIAGSGTYTWVKNATTNEVANYSLAPGTTYYYKIRAYLDMPDGTRAYGQYSEGEKINILAAVGVPIVNALGKNMRLEWNRVTDCTGYQVFYKKAGTEHEWAWLKNTENINVVHYDVERKTDYYYKVRAYLDQENGIRAYGQFSNTGHAVSSSEAKGRIIRSSLTSDNRLTRNVIDLGDQVVFSDDYSVSEYIICDSNGYNIQAESSLTPSSNKFKNFIPDKRGTYTVKYTIKTVESVQQLVQLADGTFQWAYIQQYTGSGITYRLTIVVE